MDAIFQSCMHNAGDFFSGAGFGLNYCQDSGLGAKVRYARYADYALSQWIEAGQLNWYQRCAKEVPEYKHLYTKRKWE